MRRTRICWCLALCAAWACSTAFATEERPNVVLIMADDMGYGDPGCYQSASKIPTPNIDRLAREGMRFTDAHTPSAVCTPTRYGLLTGCYSWRTRLKRGVLNGYSRALIEPGRLTLASLLAEQGYRTGCVGKWHLGMGNAEPADYSKPLKPGPNAVGFDESFVIPASLDMPPYVFVKNERATVFPSEQVADSKMRRHGGGGYWRGGAIAPGFEFVDTLPTLTDEAVKFVNAQDNKAPFFLYFPLPAPHTPWMPTEEFRGRTKVGYYGDFVTQVDATIGQVLDALDEKKLADNTLVIFTSDNGAHWLPSDIEEFGHRANADWRGQKADIWEGGHRVPFIVRWPGIVQPGSKSDQLVCLTDCMATLAELAGHKLADDEGEDSYSFLSVLRSSPPDGTLRQAIVHQSGDGTLAIRQGPWKLATKLGSHGFSQPKNVEPREGGPRGQLYHLGKDPAETTNRWLEEPQVVERLESLLTRYQQQGHSRPQP
ncbi:MAG: sulfatase [Planctomycetota bacterium]|nr:MAG: sulfatase [Planctomycetota bacterium]